MISDPIKFHYEDAKKNFSFRPKSPKYKKNIKLKPFVTDKIRVEKYLKSKQIEDEIINKNIQSTKKNKNFSQHGEYPKTKSSFFNENKEKINIDIENYLQPIMKFKPRTDLERIFDTVNSNYFGKISKNLVNEQLKSLGLIRVYNKKNTKNINEYSLLREKLKVKPETLDYLIKEKQILEQGPKTKEIHELINNMENIISINKEIQSEQNTTFPIKGSKKENKYKNKRKNLNNFLAKNILGEYQKKTHFKALCTYSLDLNTKKNFNKKNLKYKSLSFDNLDNSNDDISNNDNNIKTIYQKRFKDKKRYTPIKLSYLRSLFMKKENKHEMPLLANKDNNNFDKDKKIFEEQNDTNKIIREQNNIFINGVYYNKNDIKGISDALLKKCNYIPKHFEPENTGEGKLMFTRGMTVNEFTQKYKLPK